MPAASNARENSPSTSVFRTSTAISRKLKPSSRKSENPPRHPARLFRFSRLHVDRFHADRPRLVELASRHQGPRIDARAPVQHRLHRAQDIRAAAEVVDQFHQVPPAALHLFAILLEPLRLGMAEAEDRLVDVAHRVEPVRRADQFEQPRLLPVGVLELVHQDLVELALQARAGLRVLLQQPHRELFQVREIQRAGIALPLPVELVEAPQDLEQQLALRRRSAR